MAESDGEEAIVFARHVYRSFVQAGNTVKALMSTSCAVRPGERIAITGASGSGKSTLLHLFAGLDSPTGGEIFWPALGARDDLRPGKIAMAFQAPSLVPFLSVAENVGLPLFILGRSADANAVAVKALANAGLAELAPRLPEELSGGQAQRVALVRAMVSRPALLLADEPTAQLDQTTAKATIATLIAWAEATGGALVVATHDMTVAERFDEIWHMEHGRLTCPAQGMER
jgi:ABC-type lipoprotein export system ATPase subunit